MRHLLTLASAFGLALTIACGGGDGDDAEPTVSPDDARVMLQSVAMKPEDLPDDYVQDINRFQTNEQAAEARPDTDVASQQFSDWGQVLSYNVQYAAPPTIELVTNGKTARVMHTATVFQTPDGATQSLEFIRGLSEDTVQQVIEAGSGEGSTISDVKVTKDIEFVPKGDESFAFRAAGVASFADGVVVNFTADALVMRVGRMSTQIITVALGQPPIREELEEHADTFVARAQAADPP